MTINPTVKTVYPEKLTHYDNTTINIVGCNRVGILHTCLFADAKFKVILTDADQSAMEHVLKGKVSFMKQEVEPLLRKFVSDGKIKAVNDLKAAAAQSDVIVVTTPVKFDKNRLDYSDIEKVLKQISQSFRRGTLIIITSIVGIGASDGSLKEILEYGSGLKAGLDFYLAYSPVSSPERQSLKKLLEYERIVAARDENSLNAASSILEKVTKKGVIRTHNVRAAEAAALFKAMHEHVNISLINEFALFSEKMGIDYNAVQRLKYPNSVVEPIKPTLNCESTIAHYILLEEAENVNAKLKVSKAAMETGSEVLKHVVNMIREALRSCGKSLRRAKISILGVSQTPNTMDVPKELIMRLVKTLQVKGAKISLFDPYMPSKTLMESEHLFKRKLTEAVEGADCIIIATGHEQFRRLSSKRLKVMMKAPAAIIDLEAVLDPGKIGEEFYYRGLGRGEVLRK
ncbi:MAG: nucleotide sugar dehydrogenase [Candidatus Bathyarchaeia archaeon]